MQKLILIKENEFKNIEEKLDLLLKHLHTKPNESEKRYLKTPAAAKYLGVDRQTIANLEQEGLITRYGRGKLHLYKIEELEAAIKNKK